LLPFTSEFVHAVYAYRCWCALVGTRDLFVVKFVEGVTDHSVLRPVDGRAANHILRLGKIRPCWWLGSDALLGGPFTGVLLITAALTAHPCIFIIAIAIIFRRINLSCDKVFYESFRVLDSFVFCATESLDVGSSALSLNL
jgi:hypothetical protein